ncbi:MAG: GAF domain-containing protein, partial [Alphaproteobacteria bacterium]|nr:GAF domain-containing protein [Alphaproteobacteria bacterium]
MEAILQLHTHNKGSRLLHKLRDTLALAVISAQEKLDLIVTFIASEMNADVCSIYLLRSGTYLELFSTYGLNDGFIHKTRLKKGEGVVGEVASSGRLLVLSDAKQHKNFRLIEGIGEESLCGFVGVPI